VSETAASSGKRRYEGVELAWPRSSDPNASTTTSRARGVHVVGALAGRGFGEDAIRLLPEAVLLELVLELDAEPAAEDREVVVDGEGALRLEDAEVALAAVVDRSEGVGAPGPGARDLLARHLVPRIRSDLLLDGRRAAPAEARVGFDVRDAKPGHRFERPLPSEPLAPPRLIHDRCFRSRGELELWELRREKLGGMCDLEGKPGLSNFVIEMDA
jgi:hypothetical protein